MPLVVLAAAVLLVPDAGPRDEGGMVSAQVDARPNIVVVMTDDLDERSVQDLAGIRSVMGANGITFNNAFVTYSLCCPSRASFLRGQYPHNHQIIGNDVLKANREFRSLGRDRSTVATWLNDAGYQTKYIGKYMNGYRGHIRAPGLGRVVRLHERPHSGEDQPGRPGGRLERPLHRRLRWQGG